MTTTLTPAERGDLAERMLPIAAQLACIVHGDGDQQDIRYALGQLDHIERDALIVVLAGLVNPDTALSDALAYITWDESGRPAQPTDAAGTIRGAARQQWTPPFLPQDDRRRAQELHTRGLDTSQIGQLLNVDPRVVRRWLRTMNQEKAA